MLTIAEALTMKNYESTKTVRSTPFYCPVCSHAVNRSDETDTMPILRMNRKGEMVTYITRKHRSCKAI